MTKKKLWSKASFPSFCLFVCHIQFSEMIRRTSPFLSNANFTQKCWLLLWEPYSVYITWSGPGCLNAGYYYPLACVADALNLLYRASTEGRTIQMVWTSVWAGCNAGCYPLDKITIQRRSIWETNCTIHWTEIYPSDNAIRLLNNWGQTLNLTSLPYNVPNNNQWNTVKHTNYLHLAKQGHPTRI